MREAVGDDVDIMVDCHARPSPAMGMQFAKALEPYGLYFLEEPCWPECIESLAAINAAVSTPIATGERMTHLAAFRDLFAARGCEVCQMDLTHCGGFTEARRIAALADAHRIALAPHNPQGPVSTAASLEFGFSQPSYVICESVHSDVPWRRDIVEEGFVVDPSTRTVTPNTRPGLGIEIRRVGSEKVSVPTRTATTRLVSRWQRWRLVMEKPMTQQASTRQVSGILPVIHTPFVDGNQIDRESLRREIDWAFEVGCHGVVAAMVSEILRLTYDERMRLADDLVQLSADRGVVVASVGAESIQQAQIFARSAQRSGCHAVMAIPPISTSIPEDQLWRYFCEIAECVDVPLIVQDASSYVGGPLSIELLVRLLERFGEDKILFKPEAAPIGPNLSLLRDHTHGRARVFDGSGGILLIDAYRRGIAGTMPGTDLLDGIVAIWRALQQDDERTAYRVYFPLCAIVNLQLQGGLDGFLAIEKYLMVKRGIFTSESRRAPFGWELDQETRNEVDRLFSMLMQALHHPCQ